MSLSHGTHPERAQNMVKLHSTCGGMKEFSPLDKVLLERITGFSSFTKDFPRLFLQDKLLWGGGVKSMHNLSQHIFHDLLKDILNIGPTLGS